MRSAGGFWQPQRCWALCCAWLLACAALPAAAQQALTGTVLDEEGAGLPLTRVLAYPAGKAQDANAQPTTGANTDIDGNFRLLLPNGTWEVVTRPVGYQELRTVVVVAGAPVTGLRLALKARETTLQEVVITKKDNPAHRVIRQVIKHKKFNRLDRFDYYQYQSYSRLTFSLDNIAEADLDKPTLRAAKELLLREGIDSTHTNDSAGRRYILPIYISEAVTDVYYNRPDRKEIIVASRQKGTLEAEIPLINTLFSSIDIYQNVVPVLGKDFTSPIADAGLDVYDYYITHTDRTPTDTTYYIELYPRNHFDKAFRGILVISQHDWAVRAVDLTLNHKPGINYVEGATMRVEYAKVQGQWVPVMSDITVDFEDFLGNGKGGRGQTKVHYSDYELTRRPPPEVFEFLGTEIAEGATAKTEDFWHLQQQVPLSRSEAMAIQVMDTLRRQPIWQAYNLAVDFVMGGTKRVGPVDIGPYSKILSFNPVEGVRTQLGVYTNSRFSTRWMLGAHVAYGFRDDRLKYDVDAAYALSLRPRLEVGLNRAEEIEQTGFKNFQIEGTGLLNSALVRVPLRQLNYFRRTELRFYADLSEGVAATATLATKFFDPAFNLEYRGPDGLPARQYRTTEAGLLLRLSLREKYLLREGRKIYQGSPFPQLYVEYKRGLSGFLDGDFNYHNVAFTLTNLYRLGRFGKLRFLGQVGKIWGVVPYPSLYVFKGSQSYGIDPIGRPGEFAAAMVGRFNRTAMYDPLGFNLLYFYEFAADKYAVIGVDHYLEGWLFRKLPLIRRWNWKEVLRLRVGWGTLRPENRAFNLDGQQEIRVAAPGKIPYVEAGFGIENIFRLLEVDFLWRLTQRNPPASAFLNDPFNFNFGIRLNARVSL